LLSFNDLAFIHICYNFWCLFRDSRRNGNSP